MTTIEHLRLTDDHDGWLRWGPSLAERARSTVGNEDGPNGDAAGPTVSEVWLRLLEVDGR